MKVIAIDNSTDTLYMELFEAQGEKYRSLKQKIFRPERGRDDWLVRALDDFYDIDNLQEEKDAFALGEGPGSFTGLRILFSYIKTLAQIKRIPVITFSSLKLWQSAVCREYPQEGFLFQANRNLFHLIPPENQSPDWETLLKAQTPSPWKHWINLFRENPATRARLWPPAVLPNLPGNITIENKSHFKPVCPLPKPEKITSTQENPLPRYGHNVIFKKKKNKL